MTQNNKLLADGPTCPIPLSHQEQIVIGHGSGGLMTHELIKNTFQSRIGNIILNSGNDAALLRIGEHIPSGKSLVVSTDSHIITPIFFPGGDIGRLSVCGTVNDVAMLGGKPLYLTATFILEEGLPIIQLERVVDSMAEACQEAGVQFIAADTKVTEKGKSDSIFISTTGIGWIDSGKLIDGTQAKPGDAVIVSGNIGNHGIAIAQARGNLGFESSVQSDTAPLNHLVDCLISAVPEVHVLRDPTRGGLATTLVEISKQSKVGIEIEEESIPIENSVLRTCELLGLDPLYLANEGKMVIILPAEQASKALEVLKSQNLGKAAVVIGHVIDQSEGQVWMKTALGTARILDLLAGEMLPRIC